MGSSCSSFGFSLALEKNPSLGAPSYLGRDVTDTLAAAEKRRGQGETPSAEGVGWSPNPFGLDVLPATSGGCPS